MKKELDTSLLFPSTCNRFSENIKSLFVFINELGSSADEFDKASIQSFHNFFRKTVGLTIVDDEHDLVDKDNNSREHVSNILDTFFNSPDNVRRFVKGVKNIQSPVQGNILRRSAHITLASNLEWLLSDLIRIYYTLFPDSLADKNSLTLAELKNLGSIEEAEKHIVSKEVDSILRQGIEDQLRFFSTNCKIPIFDNLLNIKEIIEIFQRRNSLVHNSSKYSKAYFNKVDPILIQTLKVKPNENIEINSTYLINATNQILLAGLTLLQLCWRRWDKKNITLADNYISSLIYDLLIDGKHELVCQLSKMCKSLKMQNEMESRLVAINYAVALKKLGSIEESKNIIASLDWSASCIKLKLAAHIVKDEFPIALSLLPKAIEIGEIHIEDLHEWPLFDSVRTMSEFQEVFEMVPEDFSIRP